MPKTNVATIAKWAGLYDKQFLSEMLNGLDIFRQLNVDRNVSRHGKLLPKFTANDGLRPLDLNITENDGTERTLSGRKLFVYDCMKLFEIKPEELNESYLGDMIKPGARQIPFAQWFWAREMEKLASEINDNFYLSEYHADATGYSSTATYSSGDYIKFKGSYYKANQSTTAGQSPTSDPNKWDKVNQVVCFDGPAKIIADLITASDISPITTGAIDNTNAVSKIESMYKNLPTAVANKGGAALMSTDTFRDYLENERSTYSNVATPGMGDGRKFIYGSGQKWELIPCTWMGTSGRVIFDVQRRNLRIGTTIRGERAPSINEPIRELHGYKTVAKFLLGFQVSDTDILYVNDQT